MDVITINQTISDINHVLDSDPLEFETAQRTIVQLIDQIQDLKSQLRMLSAKYAVLANRSSGHEAKLLELGLELDI